MGENHRIRELMTESPRTVSSDATVVDAARVMRDDDVGLVPIVDGDRLVGTVTDRDIAIRVVAEERDPERTTVREIASTDLVTIDPEQEPRRGPPADGAAPGTAPAGRGRGRPARGHRGPGRRRAPRRRHADRPGRRADLAVELGCPETTASPAQCGARRRIPVRIRALRRYSE